MGSLRSKLVTFAAVAAAAVSGAAIASAATSGTSSSSSPTSASQTRPPHDPSKGGHEFNGRTETLLTGDVASKVRAAALAKVSGTVDRVETNVDDSAPYEAHITKSDGTQVIVEINKDYSVASVSSMGGHP
ncbi:MAG TPA: hypothetical protein VH276_19100 [Solirubrobacteraceae bacterium]|nr:hypothetical protein [Solirubrobacteraceae bacterium]